MARTTPSVLIIEDVAALAQTYASFLALERVSLTIATTGFDGLRLITEQPPDAVLLDINLADIDGLSVLREIKRRQLPFEVVVITRDGSIDLATDAMREGAFDFVSQPCTVDRLRVTVRNALKRRALSKTVELLNDEYGRDRFCGFIGRSSAMQAVYGLIQSAAPSRATVFLTGESGTGKEVCAEALHRLSKRSQGPFVPVNCAAIPNDLFESELFGHSKGAFTGAITARSGAAMRADGGTLFLDEIGEMPPAFQAKMLRFLQTGQVQRIGDDRAHSVDVRIVCATNRDPRADVAAGRFREDLFYRLHVIPIELPPLRHRADDVLLLARTLLERFASDDSRQFTGFEPEAEEALLRYAWPGNVRELQNVVRKIVVLGHGPKIGFDMLPNEVRSSNEAIDARLDGPPADCGHSGPITPLDEVVDRTIISAIAYYQGSIPKAASALKVSPSTIYRRLQSRTQG